MDRAEALGEYNLPELKKLLSDPVFVDFFNVFLSLPVFGQKLFYRLNEKRFEFDPPISRDAFYLDQSYLSQWIKLHRLPIFEKSQLNSSYRLSARLSRTQIIILDTDSNKTLTNQQLVCKSVGSALGVRNLRWYLADTRGRNALNLWLDVDQFFLENRPTPDHVTMVAFYKRVCERYMDAGSKFELAEDMKWRAFTDLCSQGSGVVNGSTVMVARAGLLGDNPPGRMTARKLERLKRVALEALQRYWLPRYVLHMHSLCVKTFGKAKVLEWAEGHLDNFSGVTLYDGDGDDLTLPELSSTSFSRHNSNKLSVLVGVVDESGGAGVGRQGPALEWNRLKDMTLYSPKWRNIARRPTIIEQQMDVTSLIVGKSPEVSTGSGLDRCVQTEDPPTHRGSAVTRPPPTPETVAAGSSVSSETDIESASSSHTGVYPGKHEAAEELVTSSDNCVEVENEMMSYHDEIFSKMLLGDENSEKFNPKFIPRNFKMKWKKVLKLCLTKENIALIQKQERRKCPAPTASRRGAVPPLHAPLLPQRPARRWDSPLGFGDEILRNKIVPGDGSSLPPIERRRRRLSSRLRRIRTRSAIPRIDMILPRDCEFRYKNKDTILAVACDRVTGGHLASWLTGTRSPTPLNYLNFWLDAQQYLLDGCLLDTAREKQRVETLAAHIVNTYLDNNSRHSIVLSKVIGTLLRKFLLTGEGDVMLAYAQDEAVAVLIPAVETVWRSDVDIFQKHVLVKKRQRLFSKKTAAVLPSDGEVFPPRPTAPRPHADLAVHEFRPSTQDVIQGTGFDIATLLVPQEGTLSPPAPTHLHEYMQPTEWLEDERSHIAFSLIYDVWNLGYTLGKMCIDVSSLFSDSAEDDGSLTREKQPVIRKCKPRCGKALAACAVREYPRGGYHADSADDGDSVERTEDSRPLYLKPIRRNGRIIYRPLRPRHFYEIMRDQIQLEFFKRFLMFHAEEAPLLFWLAVEVMRTKDTFKARQQKAQNIIKKYFSKAAGKGEILKCSADVIKEIHKMPTVTPAMLYSAQACVVRSIEERWFLSYIETFPEEEEFPDEREEEGTRREPEFSSQDRTAKLWQVFIHGVTSFRRGILSPFTSRLFQTYLIKETDNQARENEEAEKLMTRRRHSHKKPPHHPPAHGPEGVGLGTERVRSADSVRSVKQVINNKVVFMDRLDKDLSFWAEVERYKDLADSASKAVASGTYSVEDQELLQMKALAIINCFLDSQVPPKVQVNISDELASVIVNTAHAGMFERGLFHDAALTIFNILIFYWKRFCRDKFTLKVQNSQQLVDAAMEVKRCKTPDFTNIPAPVKRFVDSNDECTHLVFTMLQGLRLYVPLPRAISPKSFALHELTKGMLDNPAIADAGHHLGNHGHVVIAAVATGPSRHQSVGV